MDVGRGVNEGIGAESPDSSHELRPLRRFNLDIPEP